MAGIIGHTFEYVLWGLPRGATERYEEVVLIGGVTDPRILDKVETLASADGFHSFRSARIDLTTPPDFTKTLNISPARKARTTKRSK